MSIQETTANAAASAARAYTLPRSTTAAAAEKSQESRKFEDIEDPIEISPQGRLASILASGTEGLIGVAPQADGSVHLEDMMARLSEISTDLQGVLGNKFRTAGIDTSKPIDLETDSHGNVRVANDHPDKEKIEQIFADDPALANDFRGVQSLQSLVSAAEKHLEFIEAYAADPEGAVAQFGVGNNGIETDILLRLADGELSAVDRSLA